MKTTKIEAATETLIKRTQQPLESIDSVAINYLTAAESLLDRVRKYRSIKNINPLAAQSLKREAYQGAALKWLLNNEVVFIENESLKLLWQDAHIGKNAGKYYKTAPAGLNSGSKLAVCEHVYPSILLKEEVFETAPIDSYESLLRYILNRAIISWTAAIEDTKLREGGWNSSTPDKTNLWARYEATNIQTFELKPEFISSNGHDLKIGSLLRVSAKMKAAGSSFEEFKSAVTF